MRRHENLGHDFLLAGDLRVVGEHHAVAAHIGLHPVHSRNLFHPCLESHRTAIALHRLQALHLHCLEFHTLLHSEGLVDGRKFEIAADYSSEHSEQHCQHCRKYLAGLGFALRSDTYVKGAGRTGGYAFAAKHTVNRSKPFAFCRHIDMVRAGLLAGHAMAPAPVLVHNYRKRLDLGSIGNDLKEIAHHAECSKIPRPGNLYAQQREHPEEQSHREQRNPEFEAVGKGPERAYIPAPEPLDEKAQQKHQGKAHQAHPKGDFTLEAGCDGIIRVEILAEKLAGSSGAVEYPEQKHILDCTQDIVKHALMSYLHAFETYCRSGFCEQVLNCSYRADVGAEKLAEENHARSKHKPHHYLQTAHRARQRTSGQESDESLNSAHRAISFRIASREGYENY